MARLSCPIATADMPDARRYIIEPLRESVDRPHGITQAT
jgi:hypothetical protein